MKMFKKLVLASLVTLSAFQPAVAADNSVSLVTKAVVTSGSVRVQIVCLDGYKYAITWMDSGYSSPSITQMFKAGYSHEVSVPVACNK